MANPSLQQLLASEDELYQLIASHFPSARLSRDKFRAILHDAQTSSDPALQALGLATSVPSVVLSVSEAAQASAPECTVYALEARHQRSAPFQSEFTQACQAVRVRLPAERSQAAALWTRLGVVKPADHLLFSVAEVGGRYQQAFGTEPTLARVDLITGARYLDLTRFSPVSIYLAYETVDASVPSFYYLESGSATGDPEALYYVQDMQGRIHASADFAFTPFACPANWYTGGLTMNAAQTEPESIDISVAQQRDGQRHYLDLNVSYAVTTASEVMHPGAQFIVAVMRVFALGLGLQLETNALARAFGLLCRDAVSWQTAPPTTGQAEGYRGCLGADG